MREFINFFKELFMLKKDTSMVGLSGFKRRPQPVRKVVNAKKETREVKLSDLMRRAV